MTFNLETNVITIEEVLFERMLDDVLIPVQNIIPAYQRPYSWDETQIERLINGILESKKLKKPYFLGTVQTTSKGAGIYEIIDGQQRLTTLLLMFEALLRLNNDLEYMIRFETKVSSTSQQEKFDRYISDDLSDSKVNQYVQNGLVIKKILDDHLDYVNIQSRKILTKEIFEYLKTSVHVVCITTIEMKLSETLEIFDRLNTAGLDLDTKDIFKIRLHEYLELIEGEGSFEKIDKLYSIVDQINSEANEVRFSVDQVLCAYQQLLVGTHFKTKTSLLESNRIFFNKIFDIGNTQYDEKPLIKLVHLEKLISAFIKFFECYDTNPRFYLYIQMIWKSRYARYWYIPVLMFYYNENKKDIEEILEETQLFMRVLVIYSVRYKKAVNEIHSFIVDLLKNITRQNDVTGLLKERITESEDDLYIKLNENIVESPKAKYLLMVLSAAIDEISVGELDLYTRFKSVLEGKIDIEHISPVTANQDDKTDKDVVEWQNELNKIGNLMILEYDINRSIQNKSFATKIKSYKSSKYITVRNIADCAETWSIDDAQKRRANEFSKLSGYLVAN